MAYTRTKQEITLFWLVKQVAENHLEESELALLIEVALFAPFEFSGFVIIAFANTEQVTINTYESLSATMANILSTKRDKRGWLITIVHAACPTVESSYTSIFDTPMFSLYLPGRLNKYCFNLSIEQYNMPLGQLLHQCLTEPDTLRKNVDDFIYTPFSHALTNDRRY